MISIIIPTYKNRQKFLANLKHNLNYLKDMEIIIVNDDPLSSLKDEFKTIKNCILIENNVNLGFGESVNKGVQKAHNPYVMLLNDDVILQDDTFKKTLSLFKKDLRLFAVGFSQKEKDNIIVGSNLLYWKRGLFFHAKAHLDHQGYNGWAEGGASMMDKSKFEELGGFDGAYAPFYWEDIDLSYRAWKSGYHILFDPSVTVIHHHESTIGTYFDKSVVKTIAFRNQFIFIWKNISDTNFKWSHVLLLPYNLFYYSFKGEWTFLKGFIMAFPYLSKIKKTTYPISDKTILNQFHR